MKKAEICGTIKKKVRNRAMERISYQNIKLVISPDMMSSERAEALSKKFETADECEGVYLKLSSNGLSLCDGSQSLMGDFTRLIPRVKAGVSKELLVRAAKVKNDTPFAIDATAGLGDDSFFLAAAGFNVTMFERNPIIFELLTDAVLRASEISGLDKIVARMTAVEGDSIEKMAECPRPDIVLLDPMFPERQKSALVKKKLQMIQRLESPCIDERALMLAAINTRPKKLIVKRPPKGPYLADIKPDHSIEGKAVRFDCIVSPWDRIDKFWK